MKFPKWEMDFGGKFLQVGFRNSNCDWILINLFHIDIIANSKSKTDGKSGNTFKVLSES